jgi:hypothetical protein
MTDLREDLTAAFNKSAETSAGEEDTATVDEPKVEDAAPTAAQPAAQATAAPAAAEAPKEPSEPAKEAPPPNAPAPTATPPVQGAQPVTTLKAPASFKPEVRVDWDKVPPPVQMEIHRREREISEAMRSSAEARRFADEFRSTLAPYEMLIRANNSTPLQAVDNSMRTAAALRTSPPMERAGLVATIIQEYGIDIQLLDNALSGNIRNAPPAPDPYVQQQIQPLVEFVNQFKAQQQQASQRTEQEAQVEIEQFFANEEQFPYANDLRDEIADVLELSARRGVQMSLQDAYGRATMLHPTISKLVENRGVASQVAQQNAAAQKARNTAVSVRNAPAQSGGSAEAEDDSIRGVLERSIGKSAGRI